MKSIASFISIALIVWSCGDEKEFFTDTSIPTGARIKFIHAASDTVGVNFFIDGIKVSGGGSSIIPATQAVNIGTIGYQSAFPITNYTTVSSANEVKVIVPEVYTATLTYPTKTLLTKSITTEAEGYYSIAFVGITSAYDAVLINDDLSVAPLDEKAYVRFGNFIHNSVSNMALRLTPPATTENPSPVAITLFPNVAYKGVTEFVALPTTGLYTNVQIVDLGTGLSVGTLAAGSSTFTGNNVYTIFARGQLNVAGTKAPGVTRITNR